MSPVYNSYALALGSGNRSGFHKLDVRTDRKDALKFVRKPPAQSQHLSEFVAEIIPPDLDLDLKRIQTIDTVHNHKIHRLEFGHFENDAFHLRREDIDPTDNQHVITSSYYPCHPHVCPAAVAFAVRQGTQIPGPVPEQRHACLRESGESYGKAWYVLGKYYSRQKRHYESVECFEKGIRVLRNDSCNRGSEIMKYEYFILRERSEEGRFSDFHKAEVERQLVSLYNGKDFPNFGFNRPVYLLLLLKLYLRFEKIDSSLVCDVLLNLLSLSSRGCFLSVYRLRDMFDLLDEVLNKRDVLSLSSEYVCEFEKFKESIDLEIEYWKSFGEKLDSLSKVWPRFRVQLVPGLERLRHESDEDHQIDARVCGFHLKYVIELLDESQRKEIGDMIEDFLKKYKRE